MTIKVESVFSIYRNTYKIQDTYTFTFHPLILEYISCICEIIILIFYCKNMYSQFIYENAVSAF